MTTISSPEQLIPLAPIETTPQAELVPLQVAPAVEKAELPVLQVEEPAEPKRELPVLNAAPIPDESEPKKATQVEAKPSALKPAFKIGRTTIAVAQAKIAVGKTKARASSKTSSVKESLSDRKLKIQVAYQNSKADVIPVIVSKFEKGKRTERATNRKQKIAAATGAVMLAGRNMDTKNAGLKLVTFAQVQVKDRFGQIGDRYNEWKARDKDQAPNNRKRLIIAGVGLVALGAAVYLHAKGFPGSDNTNEVVSAGPDPTANTVDIAPKQVVTPEVSHVTDTAPVVGEAVSVDSGDGIGNLIEDRANQLGVDLTGSEIYEMYKEIDINQDGNLITGDTYRMKNGDLGISSPGNFAWQHEAQKALDELIEAKKKKKGLG